MGIEVRLTYPIAKIDALDVFIVYDFQRVTMCQNLTVIYDIRAVCEFQRLPPVVIRDQNADVSFLELADERLNIADGERIDAGKRFI